MALLWSVLVLLGIALTLGVLYGIYFLLTMPLRRAERARLFLDVLELGLKDGRTPEAAVISAALSRDAALGVRFHWVAAYLEQGRTLGQALGEVKSLLPRSVAAMLIAGERTGNVRQVIPACRRLLVDAISQVRGALNYLLLITFAVTPAVVVIPFVLKYKVVPVFGSIFEGMPLPAFSRLVFSTDSYFIAALMIAMLLMWALAIAYVGGPRLRSFFGSIAPFAVDRFLFSIPWRRKRLLRDFTSILSILLDSGIPEAEAVRLAGESTDNMVIKTRAEGVRKKMASGIALHESIAAIDDSGQFHWRLRNALQRGKGFVNALSGWHELLDARAFQQEQTAAQLLTTFLVLFNGAIIGSIALGFFLVIINMLHQATLW